MLTKTFTCYIFFILFINNAFSQKQNVYFLKNDGATVGTKDSADFIRIVSEPDTGTELYNLRDYYVNGKPKSKGKTSRVDGLTLSGPFISFSQAGKRERIATYDKGMLIGDVYNYFPNGKLYTVKQQIFDINLSPNENLQNFKILTQQDSIGNILITNGNGKYIGYRPGFETIAETGALKEGKREGVWTGCGTDIDSIASFNENYEDGELKDGKSIDKNGMTYNYSQREVVCVYEGGDLAFNQYLAHHIHYPLKAKKGNIQGKVILQFIVEIDGSLTNFKVLQDPYPDLTAEALRVIKVSPKWIPGSRYGRKVRLVYLMPVNFSLAE